MNTEKRIDALENRRTQLKTSIAAENARLHPDALALMRLKKEKCAVKDQIAALRQQSDAAAA